MSIAAVNAPPSHAYVGQELPPTRHSGEPGAEHASASFQVAKEVAMAAMARLESTQAGHAPWGRCGTPFSRKRAIARKGLDDQDCRECVKALVDRMRSDPSLGPQSDAAKRVGTLQASLTSSSPKPRKRALWHLAEGRQRNAEGVGQLRGPDRASPGKGTGPGHHADRGWAERWIERQFDYDSVDADHQAGNSTFALRAA